MKRKISLIFLIFFICSLFSINAYSQGEFNNWYFGQHAGLNFSSGSPVVLNNCSPLFFCQQTTATVSDSTGNLLFYADFVDVFNRNHAIVPNGNGLYCDHNSSQPVFPVQKLDDDSAYFLFTIDASPNILVPNPHGFTYSVIDMRLDGGLGDIVSGEKNLPVPGGGHTSVMLSGTRHHNNHDAWIVVRRFDTTNYLSYLITNSGINTVPVVSNSRVKVTFPTFDNDAVMVKISPDGKKLIALYDSVAEYCAFNSQTGAITSLFAFFVQSSASDFQRAKAEFSIDSKYLYISHESAGQSGNIMQYDASRTDSALFKQSEFLIYTTGYTTMMTQF